jgi:xylulokinase
MLFMGIDIGTSSVKLTVLDNRFSKPLVTVQYPEKENTIISLQDGWAEQSPDMWWEQVQQVILKANATGLYHSADISAIGISYQMHGLVMINDKGDCLRNSIIWCDSRAVAIGHRAFEAIGPENCLQKLLNSPGNFTAAKLAWVQQHEPELFRQIHQIMLPGDFIAYRLTGTATTTSAALSEGIFWDFSKEEVSKDIFNYFGWEEAILPPIQPVFSEHGTVVTSVAEKLGLTPGIPVTYKAGDQQNNAWSLQVLSPVEVAATAGTSGVIYAVTDQLTCDRLSRVNTFAHVNHSSQDRRLGVLLCINGVGILNSWVRQIAGASLSYDAINAQATKIPVGSDGLSVLPFGNGAERMLENKIVQAHLQQINFNKHTPAHLYRAAQEGIAFAFRYGLDILRENQLHPSVIRAGKANMFLSNLFIQSFVNATQTPVELYDTDGSAGAARGACRGLIKEEMGMAAAKPLQRIEPDGDSDKLEEAYQQWLTHLQQQLLHFSSNQK